MKLSIAISLLLACGSVSTVQYKWESPIQHPPTHGRMNVHRPGHDPQQRPPAEATDSEAERMVSSRAPRSPEEPVGVQEKQIFHRPMTWRFPELLTEEPSVSPPVSLPVLESNQHVAANSVAVLCGESSVRVEVERDLLGVGKTVLSSDVRLGDCEPTDQDAQVFVFESELHGCGSRLTMYEDDFVYLFTLRYTPTPITVGGDVIVRTQDVEINLECRYRRKHDVSSEVVRPTWIPYAVTEVAEEKLLFSLKLMTGDGQLERPSKQYVLGDVMIFEASVKQFHHVPLRVFVDSCVATLIPNMDTVPRYTFLRNHGCLIDGKLTDSSSHFMPRTQDDKIQFGVEAFRFQQDGSGEIYITCHLKAITASVPISAENKACSFSNGWREASGSDRACNCCDTDCGTGSQPTPTHHTGEPWDRDIYVGPINVDDGAW